MRQRLVSPPSSQVARAVVELSVLIISYRLSLLLAGFSFLVLVGFAALTAEPLAHRLMSVVILGIIPVLAACATGGWCSKWQARSATPALVQRSNILVLASHQLALITELCSRCAILKHGEIIKIGPTKDVVEEYSDSDQHLIVDQSELISQGPAT